ncbi:collagen binding domain-containing protein [Paenibacillus sp. FSL R5-0701]|uniref:collagen binding domain-containing protein n=1 Tax=Paenibacillus sp. FSL R5-0701 TaxID=2921654 RepID=UPI0030D4F0AF
MRKKVSIVIIALLLVTQMMQGWIFTPTMHAQDELTNLPASAISDTASEEGLAGSEEVNNVDVAATPEEEGEGNLNQSSLAVAAAGPVITDQLITSVQMYNQEPEYDEVTGAIITKGDPVEDTRPSIKDEVAVIFSWAFQDDTHSYGAGSTYTFDLPDKLKIESPLTGNLDGGVGEYIVNPDGQVTFTFNDQIVGSQLTGNFYVWINYDESKMDGGLKQPIVFDFIRDGDVTFNVHFANTAKDELTKSGVANKRNFNSDEINWTVDFNQGEKQITNAVLTDTLSAGPLKGTIEIHELEVQLDGSLKLGVLSDTKLEFPIILGDIDKAYRVTYTTSIKAPTKEPFTNVPYENTVELTGDQNYKETDIGRVNVSFNEPLNKSGQDSGYNPVTQTITWKVQYKL